MKRGTSTVEYLPYIGVVVAVIGVVGIGMAVFYADVTSWSDLVDLFLGRRNASIEHATRIGVDLANDFEVQMFDGSNWRTVKPGSTFTNNLYKVNPDIFQTTILDFYSKTSRKGKNWADSAGFYRWYFSPTDFVRAAEKSSVEIIGIKRFNFIESDVYMGMTKKIFQPYCGAEGVNEDNFYLAIGNEKLYEKSSTNLQVPSYGEEAQEQALIDFASVDFEAYTYADQILEGGEFTKFMNFDYIEIMPNGDDNPVSRFFTVHRLRNKLFINLDQALTSISNEPYTKIVPQDIENESLQLVHKGRLRIGIDEYGSPIRAIEWRPTDGVKAAAWYVEFINDQGNVQSLRASAPNVVIDGFLWANDLVPGDFRIEDDTQCYQPILKIADALGAGAGEYNNVVITAYNKDNPAGVTLFSADQVDDEETKAAFIYAALQGYNSGFETVEEVEA